MASGHFVQLTTGEGSTIHQALLIAQQVLVGRPDRSDLYAEISGLEPEMAQILARWQKFDKAAPAGFDSLSAGEKRGLERYRRLRRSYSASPIGGNK